ncbi:Nicotinic acid phosphoribosyltransferase [Pseudomonas syringae pv. actinidiae]|uniref:Nicotinic acid phosphoribosyltransferase n=1 Tax=Pseudomonas syringae pv. actinidiae TaxID=103796 RepID=A0A2V0QS51_PSESF|nr:Nicotinic acid phosphoribosyltransferase [Pseudomonas syringae pv. actinidiae]
MSDARMGGQLGHRLTVGCQRWRLTRLIAQRLKPHQQVLRLCISCCGRHVEPDQLRRRNPPARQLQREPGEVRLKNFCRAVSGELIVLRLGPQPVTHAWLQPPCPSGALSGAGAGDALGLKARHAAAWIETRHSRQPGINHHTHAVDGQAGFRDIGRQHHLARALGRRFDGCTLRTEVQFAMQRAQQNVGALAQSFRQLLVDPTNLGLPRKKDQQAAGLAAQRIQHRLHDSRFDKLTGLKRTPPLHRHRKHPPIAAYHRRIVQQRCQSLAFQRCRHQQNLQRLVVTKQLATIETQGQRQISVQTAMGDLTDCTILSK